MDRAEQPKERLRAIVTIVLNGVALLAFGVSMTGWLNPLLGVFVMGVAVVYWVWEIFTAKAMVRNLPGMVRFLMAIMVLSIAAGISIPPIRSKLAASGQPVHDSAPQPVPQINQSATDSTCSNVVGGNDVAVKCSSSPENNDVQKPPSQSH